MYDFVKEDNLTECLEGTQESLLRQIDEWAACDDPDAPLCFWLSGLAGTGKTTIAHTVCARLSHVGALAAKFLFAWSKPGRESVTHALAAVLYMLARSRPDLVYLIATKIMEYPNLVDTELENQLVAIAAHSEQAAVTSSLAYLIVIDGLSDNITQGARFVQLLMSAFLKTSSRVRILVVTRPMELLPQTVDDSGQPRSQTVFATLHDPDSSIQEKNVKRYLDYHLHLIAGRHAATNWPSNAERQMLNESAGSWLLYASLMVKYLRESHYQPAYRLHALLSGNPFHRDDAFTTVRDLYIRTLQSANAALAVRHGKTSHVQLVLVLAALYLLRWPLTSFDLSALLDVDKSDIETCWKCLKEIAVLPEISRATVRMVHSSFRLFLTETCSDWRYRLEEGAQHSELAVRCLACLNRRLHPNICRLEDPTLANNQVENLHEHIRRYIPDHLRYACQEWAYHVSQGFEDIYSLHEEIATFATKNMLSWIETLSLCGDLDTAIPSLRILENWIQVRHLIIAVQS
jgi:hypothetical protein